MKHHDTAVPGPTASRPRRWIYAGLGVACVGLGAIGVVVPGLPTTVFLLAASWLFTRSCPWLEERFFRLPLFRPFVPYLQPGAGMPRRAVLTTLVVMWIAIAVSSGLLIVADSGQLGIAALIIIAGLVGSFFVLRLRSTSG
jgi:uncharacterized membrane protein YbaN (DUF454 family)